MTDEDEIDAMTALLTTGTVQPAAKIERSLRGWTLLKFSPEDEPLRIIHPSPAPTHAKCERSEPGHLAVL